MRRALLATCCPVLLAIEVYRRGWAQPLIFGGCAWADAIFGYRPAWTDEPEITS